MSRPYHNKRKYRKSSDTAPNGAQKLKVVSVYSPSSVSGGKLRTQVVSVASWVKQLIPIHAINRD
jgi:hypothetical protein